MNTKLNRMTSRILIATMLAFTVPLQTVQAGMVGTEQLVAGVTQAERSRVIAFLEREDVRRALESQGVSGADAEARVAALTDAEIIEMNNRIDQLPAGGDVLGVLFAVFIILLITDVIGVTKVFPFTRSIR
jgi:hypothetical protein